MELALAIYLASIVPVTAIIGIIAAIAVALNANIPTAKRKNRSIKLLLEPMCAGTCMLISSALFYWNDGSMKLRLDDDSAWIALPAIVTLILMFTLVLKVSKRLLDRFLGSPEEEPDIQPLELWTRPIIIRALLFSLSSVAIAIYLFTTRSFSISHHGWNPGGYIGGLCSPLIMWWVQRFMFTPSAHNTDLTARAQGLADKAEVKIKEVRIVQSDNAKKYSFAAIKGIKPTIFLSQKLTEVLSSEEIDAILAHEVAHRYRKRYRSLNQAKGLTAIAMLVPAIVLFILPHYAVKPGSVFLIGISGLLGLSVYVFLRDCSPLQRRTEYEADKIALELTRNLDVMISALSKAAAYTENPKVHDFEMGLSHPKISKRLKAIRYTAQAMGLPVSDVEPGA